MVLGCSCYFSLRIVVHAYAFVHACTGASKVGGIDLASTLMHNRYDSEVRSYVNNSASNQRY